MRAFAIVLKILGLSIFLVGGLHLALGLRADALLDPTISEAAIANPTLESQNRFFGVAFTLYGALLWLVASDIARYDVVLRVMLAVFFAGGLARLVAWVQYGAPTAPTVGLLAIELVAPPLLYLWRRRLAPG